MKDLLYLERFQPEHVQISNYQLNTKIDKSFPQLLPDMRKI
jgi:hypothetical protein